MACKRLPAHAYTCLLQAFIVFADEQQTTGHKREKAMKDLELLYAQIHSIPMNQERYTERLGEVMATQKLFELKSVNRDQGFILRSSNGDYHVWFISKSVDGELVYVSEAGVWPAHQLKEAMNGLMYQMQIRCSSLIEAC